MTFAITVATNEARLYGVRDYIDNGPGPGAIRIYGGTRPATVNDAPSTSMLVEIALTEPCGSVGSNALTLTAAGLAQIAASGIATWARVVTGNGATMGDGDVTDTNGTGDIKISNTTLWQGAYVSLISAVLS